VTLPEMTSKLAEMAMEIPGEYTLHNTAVPLNQARITTPLLPCSLGRRMAAGLTG
jgi:hypothetical protein